MNYQYRIGKYLLEEDGVKETAFKIALIHFDYDDNPIGFEDKGLLDDFSHADFVRDEWLLMSSAFLFPPIDLDEIPGPGMAKVIPLNQQELEDEIDSHEDGRTEPELRAILIPATTDAGWGDGWKFEPLEGGRRSGTVKLQHSPGSDLTNVSNPLMRAMINEGLIQAARGIDVPKEGRSLGELEGFLGIEHCAGLKNQRLDFDAEVPPEIKEAFNNRGLRYYNEQALLVDSEMNWVEALAKYPHQQLIYWLRKLNTLEQYKIRESEKEMDRLLKMGAIRMCGEGSTVPETNRYIMDEGGQWKEVDPEDKPITDDELTALAMELETHLGSLAPGRAKVTLNGMRGGGTTVTKRQAMAWVRSYFEGLSKLNRETKVAQPKGPIIQGDLFKVTPENEGATERGEEIRA